MTGRRPHPTIIEPFRTELVFLVFLAPFCGPLKTCLCLCVVYVLSSRLVCVVTVQNKMLIQSISYVIQALAGDELLIFLLCLLPKVLESFLQAGTIQTVSSGHPSFYALPDSVN
jgi:hypothetical protein